MPPASPLQRLHDQLRAHALAFPETDEHFPWGHTAIKVRGKAFLFMTLLDGKLSLSTKLPESREAALLLPFAEPTGYGLGKSGWISASFTADDAPPPEMLQAWVDESFRAIAPKTLVARLGGAPAAKTGAKSAAKTGAKSAAKTGAKPAAAKKVPKPVAKVAKPAVAKKVARPGAKVAKPAAAKKVAKPVAKVAKPAAAKPAKPAKPAAKRVARPASPASKVRSARGRTAG